MNRQLKPLFILGTALLLATACTNDDTDTVDITRPIDLHLSPARTVTAETKVAIDVEVTPKSMRMRKVILDELERKRANRKD